jgi:hypothetical protein
MQPIDNTGLLTAVHEVLSLGDEFVDALERDAVTDTQKETVDMIRTVVRMHANVIRKLTEQQVDLTEHIERMLENFEKK